MGSNTYVALDKTTVTGSSVASVTLNMGSTISQAYTDLVVVVHGSTATAANMYLRFNGDTGSNYSAFYISSAGTTKEVGRNINASAAYAGAFYGTASFIAHIMNYSNTTSYKSLLIRTGDASQFTRAFVDMWRSTSAITSVTVYGAEGNLNVGTTVSLYGIKSWAAETSTKATGGYVYSDATYFYHVFPYSGTFTPNQSLSCDYLVVAGGGGGSYDVGGGGGAGGLRSTVGATGGGGSLESALSLTAQAYTVTVGAGGVGALTGSRTGANGSDSTISTITSTGGGGGGHNGGSGASGGSGGGGSRSGGNGGAGTSGQGYAGGNGTGNTVGAGGGGGAGSAGSSASTGGGAGGNGVQITALAYPTSTGVNNGYYAGGGGGGSNTTPPAAGGLGGGGQGGTPGGQNISSGATGTGSGGGGCGGGDSTGFGNGGSGLVIVRYAK